MQTWQELADAVMPCGHRVGARSQRLLPPRCAERVHRGASLELGRHGAASRRIPSFRMRLRRMASWPATASHKCDPGSGGASTSEAVALGLLPVLRQVLQRHGIRRLLLPVGGGSFRSAAGWLHSTASCSASCDTGQCALRRERRGASRRATAQRHRGRCGGSAERQHAIGTHAARRLAGVPAVREAGPGPVGLACARHAAGRQRNHVPMLLSMEPAIEISISSPQASAPCGTDSKFARFSSLENSDEAAVSLNDAASFSAVSVQQRE